MDLFLKLDGIEGESRDLKHSKEIDILDWSWGLTKPPRVISGGSTTGRLAFSGFTVRKLVDKATSKLMLNCSQGKWITNALLTCRTQTSSNTIEFYKLQASKVIVTSVNEAASSEITETVGFAFESVQIDYFLIRRTGTDDYFYQWNLADDAGTGGTRSNDTDGDGIPDDYETANGLNVNANDANLDKDGDGLSNLNEYLAGTSANNPNSVLKATLTYTRGASNATLSWQSVAGKQYTILYSDTVGGSLSALSTYTASNATSQITVPANLVSRFFRVRVQ
jgi:type VI secretion system secreted protein Hcp